jgi:Protein of unknown function (DUF2934)
MAIEIEDQIRVRAYHLWEANGRPEGRDLEFWEQARQTSSQPISQQSAQYEPAARKRRATRSQAGNSAAARASKTRRRPAEHPRIDG